MYKKAPISFGSIGNPTTSGVRTLGVGVIVGVFVGTGVLVAVAMFVGLGVLVAVGVLVLVGVLVKVGILVGGMGGVLVGVLVAVAVLVAVGMTVGGNGVLVGGIGVTVGCVSSQATINEQTSRAKTAKRTFIVSPPIGDSKRVTA